MCQMSGIHKSISSGHSEEEKWQSSGTQFNTGIPPQAAQLKTGDTGRSEFTNKRRALMCFRPAEWFIAFQKWEGDDYITKAVRQD